MTSFIYTNHIYLFGEIMTPVEDVHGRYTLPGKITEESHPQISDETYILGVRVQAVTDYFMEVEDQLACPRQYCNVAHLNCFIEGIIAEYGLTGKDAEQARTMIGSNCFEVIDRVINELRGGKSNA